MRSPAESRRAATNRVTSRSVRSFMNGTTCLKSLNEKSVQKTNAKSFTAPFIFLEKLIAGQTGHATAEPGLTGLAARKAGPWERKRGRTLLRPLSTTL